ncbi:hypothetical protein BUALT_Bualt10G0008800 [Buddleja alternifolia]|uniref:DDE Tnp4 domain-containing protein n=1 Tax=Buddleja alternifolia TaxID=168488 RepID=A0AAV6X2B4_9LAMI|nr:hypothetical protein BUALT_Bualt10G0008800 [Buddleja alternifolia]
MRIKRVVRYVMANRIPDQVSQMRRIVEYSDTYCVNNLRMNRNAFGRLCYLLEHVGGLIDSRHVNVPEKVCMFLSTLAHHKKNCIVKHDFIRSGHTISKYFHAVLVALLKLYPLILVNPDPVEADSMDSRWKWFKARYRNRKGEVSINLIGVVDSFCKFVYILPGWDGSTADARVLRDAINRPHGFKVPSGFLTPYRGVRYHLKDWGGSRATPQNHKEYFNMCHSKARNVIECTWGMLKMRWAVLRSHAFYPIKTQNHIVMACCLLHNFIRTKMPIDPLDHLFPNLYVNNGDADENVDIIDTMESSTEWSNWRDSVANAMFNKWRGLKNRKGRYTIYKEMESSSSHISKGKGPMKTCDQSRRSWTRPEEEVLLTALKEIVVAGWKSDNGFRTGYLRELEQTMIKTGQICVHSPISTQKFTLGRNNMDLCS